MNFGWEMKSVHRDSSGVKFAKMQNVDTGKVVETDFFSANINPHSTAPSVIAESGLGDANGLMDVNKYTLQHKKYENIFSFGDAVGFDTTRTHTAAIAQNPIIKNNLIRFLQDKDPNGIYDGYSNQHLLLGHSYSTEFIHNHDFEPHPYNHSMPHHGLFARYQFSSMLGAQTKSDKRYSSFAKDQGPPYRHFCQTFDELNDNEYLASKGIAWESLLHPARQQAE